MSITNLHTGMVSEPLTAPAFSELVAAVRRQVTGQILISQARCVDDVLDLLALSADAAVRAQLNGFLAEISRLSSVRADRIIEVLDFCVAAVDIEAAFGAPAA